MQYQKAPEIKKEIATLVKKLNFNHIKIDNIYCIRSFGVKTRAIARIWGIPKLFKEVVGLAPHYIIEVNANYFDKLNAKEKTKTLIHELLHIPKTFSGALLSHRGRYHRINNRKVEAMYTQMQAENGQ